MNLLGNQFSYRRSLTRKEMRIRQDNTKRVFGKDITNLQRKGKNTSLIEKGQQHEILVRSKSVHGKKETKQQPKDILLQYEQDIIRYMIKSQVSETSQIQSEITQKMRQILVDWLIDVHQSFELKQQTLHLALSYLNSYSSKVKITKEQYQLVGITCLWIASKYEQIYPPRMQNYVQVTADTYSIHQLKSMEGKIVLALDFNLSPITSLHILQTIIPKLSQSGASLSKYILELSFLENVGKKYSPTAIVISAISLADSVYKTKSDITTLKEPAQIPKQQIVNCFKDLCSLLQGGNKYNFKALKRKFLKEKYHAVSKIRIQPK